MRSVCRRRVRSSPKTASAPERSPDAASRPISARWASSGSGASAAGSAGKLDGPAELALGFRARREALQQLRGALAALLARLVRPFVLETGQELARAELECFLELPVGLEPVGLRDVDPDALATPTRSRDATSAPFACSPSCRRSDQSALRRLARALSSRTSGQKRDATAERACSPGFRASQASSAVARSNAGDVQSTPSTSTRNSPIVWIRSTCQA